MPNSKTASTDNHCQVSRREFLVGGATALGIGIPSVPGGRHLLPIPSTSQVLWQHDELAMFVHFGINTFTDREWGNGTEDPEIFNPRTLDARQWAKAARAAGFRAMVLTAKHHDGFCLWPTATTQHSVVRSPWQGGHGDVVREFTTACKEEGLRAGLYLSPWDQNHPSYGDGENYNRVYAEQLTELLTRYGPIHEVWFDGANGEGPNGKKQIYDWPGIWKLVRRLQPEAVIFSDAGPDIRWIGNERGVAGETNWSMVDPSIVPVPGMSGNEVMRSLTEGDRNGTVWRPGETDTSIRPGWFYHPAEDDKLRSIDDLVELYFTSVGRNSKLLLNVPPNPSGLISQSDIVHLTGMHTELGRLLASEKRLTGSQRWEASSSTTGTAQLTFGEARSIGIIDLREEITVGQRVAKYLVEGLAGNGWRQLAVGTTIGHRRLHRIDGQRVSAIRLRVEETIDVPLPVTIRAWSN